MTFSASAETAKWFSSQDFAIVGDEIRLKGDVVAKGLGGEGKPVFTLSNIVLRKVENELGENSLEVELDITRHLGKGFVKLIIGTHVYKDTSPTAWFSQSYNQKDGDFSGRIKIPDAFIAKGNPAKYAKLVYLTARLF